MREGERMTVDPEQVLVRLDHPFGPVEVTLAEWIARGPGGRPLVRPVSARDRRTGLPLPLSVIPPRYRNDGASRRMIAAGELEAPW
jgi:hypothetical protein